MYNDFNIAGACYPEGHPACVAFRWRYKKFEIESWLWS